MGSALFRSCTRVHSESCNVPDSSLSVLKKVTGPSGLSVRAQFGSNRTWSRIAMRTSSVGITVKLRGGEGYGAGASAESRAGPRRP